MTSSSDDLKEAAQKLKQVCYPLRLTVHYLDGGKDTLHDYILADDRDGAIRELERYIEGLDERGCLNLTTRVISELRDSKNELFYANINS
jgi:hypothetical protein